MRLNDLIGLNTLIEAGGPGSGRHAGFSTRYLYHGTSSKYLAAIKQKGLKPGNRKTPTDPAYVHVTRDPEEAAQEAHWTANGDVNGKPGVGGEPVVLKIDRFHPSLRSAKFGLDKTTLSGLERGLSDLTAFRTTSSIHPKAIAAIHKIKNNGPFGKALGEEIK